MHKITPFLWFNGNAEEAMNHYVATFRNSKVLEVSRAVAGGPWPAGSVMSVTFELEGQRFHGLNGGPKYSFTPAISMLVDCATQEEVDHLWERLLEGGGQPQACGWLTDRFGLSWQIIPTLLGKLLRDKDAAKAGRVAQAMLQMVRIDMAALQRAADGV